MDVFGLIDIPQWILILIGLLTAGYITYEGVLPILMVSEPELIRQILVKDFPKVSARRKFPFKEPSFDDALSNIYGERWKWMRAVVSQTFSSGKMRRMSPLVSECTKSLLENLNEASKKNEPVDCKRVMGAFTMDVIARCAFGMKIDTHKDPNNPFVMNAKQVFDFRITPKLILAFIMPKILELFETRFVKKEVWDFFREISQRLIKERNEKKKDRVDYLQLLLDASEFKNEPAQVEGEPETSQESLFDLNDEVNGTNHIPVSGLKKKAGYETTATTLSFALYHLALNPEIQDRLAEEIREAFKEHGEIEYDTLKTMPYLEAVVSETLRINSPATRLERRALEDFPLGDTGIVVPKDALIGVPVYSIHHDPEYYPEPEKFNPERFMPENKHGIIPYTYLPFGGGPRNCVALRFALMEAKICLANVLKEYKFSRCAETKIPLEYNSGNQLLQPRGIVLKVEKRS